jgi:acyl-CoA-dependent ceramide synthase
MCSIYAFDPDHLLGLSLNLLLLLSLTHMIFPRARLYTRLFLEMSYYNPIQRNYTQGWDDMYFVVTWITVITGLRVAVMDYMLKPIARYGGVHSKKSQTRFAEQGWLFCYYSVFSPLGMVSAGFTSTHIFSQSHEFDT